MSARDLRQVGQDEAQDVSQDEAQHPGQDETRTAAHDKCVYCGEDEEAGVDENWVRCEKCKQWAHYCCADVDDSVKKTDWFCPVCAPPPPVQQLAVPKKTRSKSKSGSKSDSGSVRGAESSDLSDKQFEEAQKARERDFMRQMEVRQRRLQVELEWQARQMELERKFAEQEREAKRKLHDAALKQEEELMNNQLEAEREFIRQRDAIRSNVKSSLTRIKELQDEKAAGPSTGKPSEEVKTWLKNHEDGPTSDRRGAYKKGGKPLPCIPVDPKRNLSPPGGDFAESSSSEDEEYDNQSKHGGKAEEVRSVASNRTGGSRDGPGNHEFRLTREQIATRKVISKTLPKFSGDPEKWPQFISCFESTTKACGFSNLENFDRLLNSLEGPAEEAVRTTLVYADSVPEVIEDLRRLFGQPELLLTKLMTKVKSAAPPSKGKPETFTHFGLIVKQLCDHLEAANLQDHLNNPMLVNQLALKLPPNERFNWIEYMEDKKGTPLKVFSNYVSKLGMVGAKAAAYAAIAGCSQPATKEKSSQRKAFVNVHNCASKESSEGELFAKFSTPCWICKRTDHRIRFCDDFRRMNIEDRLKEVDLQKLCCICLNKHGDKQCSSKLRCSTCNGGHHSLLHHTEETTEE